MMEIRRGRDEGGITSEASHCFFFFFFPKPFLLSLEIFPQEILGFFSGVLLVV